MSSEERALLEQNSLVDFKERVIQFFDELIDLLPSETDLILARMFLSVQVTPTHLMKHFISEALPYREQIMEGDDDFIIHRSMAITGDQRIDNLANIWKSNQLSPDDKESVWQWLQYFVFLAERYRDTFIIKA